MRSAYCRPASPVAPHCDGPRTGAPLVDAGPRHVDLVSCGPWTLAFRIVVLFFVGAKDFFTIRSVFDSIRPPANPNRFLFSFGQHRCFHFALNFFFADPKKDAPTDTELSLQLLLLLAQTHKEAIEGDAIAHVTRNQEFGAANGQVLSEAWLRLRFWT